MSHDSDKRAEKMELTDFIDVGLSQSMLDCVSAQLGAGIRITNAEAKVILQSGLAALCREAMRRETKHPACFTCGNIEDFSSYDEGGFALCPYCDRLINFVFNLRIGEVVEHVIIGPVWIAEKGIRPSFVRLARKFGVGQTKFTQLSRKLRPYTLEEFRKTGEMFFSAMRVIAQTLGTNLDLDKQVSTFKEALIAEKRRTWQQMIKDQLTGVYRYNYGLARLKEEVSRAERYKQSFSIVVIGIEQLRSYVHRDGPEAANAFLKRIGSVVQKKCRRTDLSARLSEEEFLIILPFTAEEGARAVAHRIRGEVRAFSLPGEPQSLAEPPSLVEGVASYPKDGQKGKELLRKALEKMRH